MHLSRVPLIMSDNDHERSEVPRLVLHVLCWGERERERERERKRECERGEVVREGAREGERRERERGRESAEAVCT